MKRLWAACLLTLGLLLSCWWGNQTAQQGASQMERALSSIEQAIETGDLSAATIQSEALTHQWATWHRVLCLFLSHTTLEQIDQNLAALPRYLQQEEAGLARATCAQLRDQSENLRDSESILLENIL